jgi:transcription termination factor NusB
MAPREIRTPLFRKSNNAALSHGARQTALAALRPWRKEKRFADSIISGFLANADLTPSDRAFALELFYGVLRNLTLLDFWVDCLRASHIETNVRDILRLGLYQVFLLKTPAHAAVHETVAIARKSSDRSSMRSFAPRPGRQVSYLHRPTRSHCSFEHLIRDFLSSVGNNTLAPGTRKSCANGTISPRRCMAGLIE